MLCRNPYVKDRSGKVFRYALHYGLGREDKLDGVPFPCGQCLSCRINRRRVWTLRLILEEKYSGSSCFVTLTYDDQHLPYSSDGRPSLSKRDAQLFLKRLRKRFSEKKIRYFLCGEYGSRTHRPHYHALLFGVSPYELDPSFVYFNGRSGETRHSVLSDTWHCGLVHVGMVSPESIQYVAGYVTKKITKKNDELLPEFSLMSRKPGIGFKAVDDISSTLRKFGLAENLKGQLRVNGKMWPLGRFLLEKLRSVGISGRCVDDYFNDLSLALSQASKDGKDLVDFLLDESAQRNRQIDARDKLFNTRSTL